MDNPYSTPSLETSVDTAGAVSPSAASTSLFSIARPTFLAWERLRMVFIVMLGLLTLLLAGPNLTKLRTLVMIAEGAIVANLCYFAGPITETYVRWLGYERKWVRWFLFVGGTMLTGILAIVTMASMFLPDQD